MKNSARVCRLLEWLEEYNEMLGILEAEKEMTKKNLKLLKSEKGVMATLKRVAFSKRKIDLFSRANERFMLFDAVGSLINEVELSIKKERWEDAYRKAGAVYYSLEGRELLFLDHKIHPSYSIFTDRVKDFYDFIKVNIGESVMDPEPIAE